jgi:hypothetical protein
MELKLWKCPKCKREFKKKNQQHSCVVFPLKNHLKDKELARGLFEYLKKQIEKKIGLVKIESLPCCIHLVSNYTFGAGWALKDRIRIDFRVDHKIKTKKLKIWKMIQMSPNRYLYYFEIYDKKEIGKELLEWIKEAYNLNRI